MMFDNLIVETDDHLSVYAQALYSLYHQTLYSLYHGTPSTRGRVTHVARIVLAVSYPGL